MAFQLLNNTFTDLAVTSRLENVSSFLKELDLIIEFKKLRPILKKVEADNKAIDVLIEEELQKEKPSRKTVDRLLKKKAYNSKTLKNEELDEIQDRHKRYQYL